MTIRRVYTMPAGFEWDPAKNAGNIAKHGIDFVRALRIFAGVTLERLDLRRYYGEPRIIATGEVGALVLTVVYTPRGSIYRLISARRANRREKDAYRQVRPPEAV